MNGFDQLVWREWRHSRTILFVALALIAAVMAIAIPVAVPWVMFSLQAPFLAPASFFGLWIDSEGIPQPLTFLVAAAFFAAGSAVYLRRLE